MDLLIPTERSRHAYVIAAACVDITGRGMSASVARAEVGSDLGGAGSVAVVGAGAEGGLVARSVAAAGLPVLVADGAAGAVPADAGIVVVTGPADEAAVRGVLAELEARVAPDCLLVTAAGILSPTELAAGLQRPGRLVGLHVVDPPSGGPLVEVVPGLDSSADAVQAVAAWAASWARVVVCAGDVPGHVVHRVLAPFLGEAWRLHEERVAAPAVIDALLVGAGGLPTGPFALMDHLGHDVVDRVARSLWAAYGGDRRYAPSSAQRAHVAAGRLGRATGRGAVVAGEAARSLAEPGVAPLEVVVHGRSELVTLLHRSGVAQLGGDRDLGVVELPCGAMLVRRLGVTAGELAAQLGRPVVVVDHTGDDETATAVAVAASEGCPPGALAAAAGLLQKAGLDVYVVDDVPGLVVARCMAMLTNAGVDAVQHGVAAAADVDLAVGAVLGRRMASVEWARVWGARRVLGVLDALVRTEGDPRYRASTLLRRWAHADRAPL